MQEQRIEMLKQMLKESPSDPFLSYALALEYQKKDQLQAMEWFQKLLTEHPNYLPTYYHTASTLITLGKLQQAKTVYEKGITLARHQQDTHALRELQNAYQNLLLDLDEL